MTPEDIEKDMKNIHQKRFLRELNSLKISADYSSLDPSHVHVFLKSIDPQLCLYTYSMLKNGITLDILTASPNADDLMDTCGIKSKVHRLQLTTTLKKLWPEPHKVIPKIRLDFFISYRQDTGAELASLIKMHLELRGYRVRMDIDKNGEQDISESLLRDVQAARNFLLVISPDNPYSKDIPCHTQLHKELRTAIQNEKNIIAVYHKDYDETRDTICLLPYDKQYLRVNWVHDYQDACVQRIVKYMYK
ncbi:hypothetical protein CRE_13282 [Caenorhabditis remanei]|uniref:TIR domain-containing protein n=1 Tax=Caenorhabditis remanei TaxID=31234 RepID=E3M8H4_CAERE|nr:hypothetical protein CRE_13282 [Caenorhabditis remanei]